MERTPPQNQAVAMPQEVDVSATDTCVICGDKMLEEHDLCTLSECSHSFHRNCMENHLASSTECPICKRQCSLAEIRKEKVKGGISSRGKPRGAMAKTYKTRSQARNPHQDSFQNSFVDLDAIEGNLRVDTDVPRPSVDYGYISRIVKDTVTSTMQANRDISQPSVDYDRIGRMVENTVTRMVQNLNLIPLNSGGDDFPLGDGEVGRNPESDNRTNRGNFQHHNRAAVSNYDASSDPPRVDNDIRGSHSNNSQGFRSSSTESRSIRPDKLTAVIRDWNIRFDGSHSGISVEEFLYRVRTLTKENLNDDFSQLCRNLPLLLTGKAQDWYWRYHKQVPQIEWEPFCAALKYQYKEFRSAFDIKEEIRSRKMRTNETFESFYESISSLLDRLDTPMPEQELIEILTRNLRPEIRHELLYVSIFSIAHLRKLVQMRESLLGDEQFRKGLSARIVPNQGHRKIAELDFEEDHNFPLEDIVQSVDAVQHPSRSVKCWNCDELGHYWEDCECERKIFCYGCGEKNTYKPQCAKCASRKLWKPKN